MYQCHLHIYMTGGQDKIFEAIKEMAPLEHFTHEFSECEELNDVSGIGADVVLANLRGPGDRDALQKLLAGGVGRCRSHPACREGRGRTFPGRTAETEGPLDASYVGGGDPVPLLKMAADL